MAVGFGMLLRRNWARWLVLGMSFVAWTLGSVALIWTSTKLLWAYLLSKGVPIVLFAIGVFFCALFAAFIWLSFRLYEHLNSDEGREEFKTADTEKHAVAKSTAVHIVWWVI